MSTTAASGESCYIELGAGRFHYRRWARPNAPAAILVHGNGSTWRTWSRVGPALHSAGLEVFAPDLRGNGSSVKPPAGSYGLPEVADDLHDFIDARQLSAPLLIGHCWGAAAALVLATGVFSDRVPPALRGLVLEELPADMSAPGRKPAIQDLLRILRGPRSYARRWIELVCRDWHPTDRESLLADVLDADLEIYLSTMDDGAAAGPLLPLLARLEAPALVLRGEPQRGGILNPADWDLARRLLPDHSIAYHVADSGHEIHRSNYAGFMRRLEPLLTTAPDVLN